MSTDTNTSRNTRQIPDFHQRCYQALLKVPAGKVTTYGELARAIGSKASRAVGTAMANNQQLITIPCHRVVRSNGEIGQYANGSKKKAELLKSEGVSIENGKIINFDQFKFRF